jgi:hypothetical protein
LGKRGEKLAHIVKAHHKSSHRLLASHSVFSPALSARLLSTSHSRRFHSTAGRLKDTATTTEKLTLETLVSEEFIDFDADTFSLLLAVLLEVRQWLSVIIKLRDALKCVDLYYQAYCCA